MIRTSENQNGGSFLPLSAEGFAPHSKLFLAFNALYFLPLLGVLFFNYSEGGATTAADLDPDTFVKIAWIYAAGCFAFLCGSRLDLLRMFSSSLSAKRELRLFRPTWMFWAACLGVVGALLVSKVLLIRAGVYAEYAFDTESMTGGAWSFSMFCAESLLFLSITVLFSRMRWNVLGFFLLSAVNGANLLHGTRVFTIIAGIVLCFYLYLRRKFNLRLALVALAAFLAIGYFIFLTRSNAALDEDSFSFTRIISPVMFEGVFSQISLIQAVHNSYLWSYFGSPLHFFADALYFLAPRILLPQKEAMLYADRFADLSPLGAFSGYAQGLIYFGVAFPAFYFTLGTLATWLFRRAKDSSFWSVIYVYFACDFLFRVMRDGYIIPLKMLIDALIILAVIALFDPSTLAFARRSIESSFSSPRIRPT